MKWSATETKVEMLLHVLDEDIRHVEAVLTRLDTLRTLLIQRNDRGLAGLLDEIREQAESYAAHEQKRQALRTELAVQLGCRPRELTLSKLKGYLPGPHRTALAARQTRLRTLIAQLQREHMLTTLLIADCARFNRALRRALFGILGQGNVTYSPTGAAQPQGGAALMSLHL
jgi:hypothetical protein